MLPRSRLSAECKEVYSLQAEQDQKEIHFQSAGTAFSGPFAGFVSENIPSMFDSDIWVANVARRCVPLLQLRGYAAQRCGRIGVLIFIAVYDGLNGMKNRAARSEAGERTRR